MRSRRAAAVLAAGLCLARAPAQGEGAGAADTVPLAVQVVDGEGQPVAGAGLIAGPATELYTDDALKRPLARSDATGGIRCRVPRYEYVDSTSQPLYAMIAHPRFATVRVPLHTSGHVYYPWGAMPRGAPVHELGRVRMLPGTELNGLVRGRLGRPLAGARIEVRELIGSGFYARSGYDPGDPAQISGAVRSDENGRFVLRGFLSLGMAMTVTADGYYTHRLSYVDGARLVDVALEPSGFLAGRVRDGAGKPVQAMLQPFFEGLSYYYGEQQPLLRTGEDGSFRLTVWQRGRCSIRATKLMPAGGVVQYAITGTFPGPREGIEIELSAAETRKPVTVEVVDQKTGRPVAGATAAVIWQDPRYLNRMVLQGALRSSPVHGGTDGRLELPAPRDQQPPSGGVIVVAKGYAPKLFKKVEYDDQKPNHLRVELEPPSVLGGVVVDPRDGRPLAGALVSAVPAGSGESPAVGPGDGTGTTRTDEQGRFRIGDLGEGEYEVRVTLSGRPDGEELRIGLRPGQQRDDLRIELPAGVSLHGRVYAGLDAEGRQRPADLGAGWMVRLGSPASRSRNYYDSFALRSGWGYGGYGNASQGSAAPVPIGADGSFRFEGLGPERYKLLLVAPPVGLRGRSVATAVEPLRVRRRDIARDFDVSEDLPGIVRGRVEFSGLQIPFGRLLVLSVPIGTSATRRPSRAQFSRSYFRCHVAADGTFAFRATPGRHHLFMMDGAASTVLYHHGEPLDIRFGTSVAVTCRVQLARLRVRLRPEREGSPIVASSLEWMEMHPGDTPNTQFGRYDTGAGCLVQGQRDFLLTLPPVPTRFCVRSQLHYVDPQGGHSQTALGEGEATPRVDRLVTLELRVAAPLEVSNPADEAGGAGKGRGRDRSKPPQPR